jgi:hypothetical protein|eukprot:COSAG06_NODE_1560_length_9104_cov_82.958468_9_plen_73_part_00
MLCRRCLRSLGSASTSTSALLRFVFCFVLFCFGLFLSILSSLSHGGFSFCAQLCVSGRSCTQPDARRVQQLD